MRRDEDLERSNHCEKAHLRVRTGTPSPHAIPAQSSAPRSSATMSEMDATHLVHVDHLGIHDLALERLHDDGSVCRSEPRLTC